jgi:hypothetical protein
MRLDERRLVQQSGHLTVLRRYIEKDSERTAAAVAKRILDAVDLLKTQPDMGRSGACSERENW